MVGRHSSMKSQQLKLMKPEAVEQLLKNRVNSKEATLIKEEDMLAIEEAYTDVLEDIAKAKQEKKKTILIGDKEEDLFQTNSLFGVDPNVTLEIILKKMTSTRKSRGLVLKLKKYDTLQNIFLQRSDFELKRIQNCRKALVTFFGDQNFPKFFNSSLQNAEFTPMIDLNLEEKERKEYKYLDRMRMAPDISPIHIINNIKTDANIHARIDANNLYDETAMDNPNQNYVKKANGKPLNVYEKMFLLRHQAEIAKRLIDLRKNEIDSMNYVEKPEVKPERIYSAEPIKRYRVNVDLVNQRELLTEMEIQERQYEIIKNKIK